MDKWNLPLILRETGGPVDLHAKLRAGGHDITLPAVRAWFRRGKIPADWVATIVNITGVDPRKWIEKEDIFGQ
jgi:hypothetical protein